MSEGVHHITAWFLGNLDPAERADAPRLAEARQEMATPLCPGWNELTDDERASSTVDALHYLRAARAAGLAP